MTIHDKIEEAKALGWEVFDRSYVHPHNNSLEEYFSYKSPRMKHVGFLHRDINLKEAEAKCVAADFISTAKMTMDSKQVMENIRAFFQERPDEPSDTDEIFFMLARKTSHIQ